MNCNDIDRRIEAIDSNERQEEEEEQEQEPNEDEEDVSEEEEIQPQVPQKWKAAPKTNKKSLMIILSLSCLFLIAFFSLKKALKQADKMVIQPLMKTQNFAISHLELNPTWIWRIL